MTRQELTDYFLEHENRDLGFIARCILSQYRLKAREQLVALYRLHQRGYAIRHREYEGIFVDGIPTTIHCLADSNL